MARVAASVGYTLEQQPDEKKGVQELKQEALGWQASNTTNEGLLVLALLATYQAAAQRPDRLLRGLRKCNRTVDSQSVNQLLSLYEQQKLSSDYFTKYSATSKKALGYLQKCIEKEPVKVGTRSSPLKVSIVRKDKRHGKVGGVKFAPLLSEEQKMQLSVLIKCVQQVTPHAVHNRNFGDGNYGNGQNAVMLQLFLESLLPDIFNLIITAAQAAVDAGRWQHSIISTGRAGKVQRVMGIRVIEFLSYNQLGGLGWHRDSDSIYTMSIMLSNPGEFSGGELHVLVPAGDDVQQGNASVRDIVPAAIGAGGTAFIFDSEDVHRVTNITSGKRKVLVIEFWPFGDAAFLERGDPIRQLAALGATGECENLKTKLNCRGSLSHLRGPRAKLNLSEAVMQAPSILK